MRRLNRPESKMVITSEAKLFNSGVPFFSAGWEGARQGARREDLGVRGEVAVQGGEVAVQEHALHLGGEGRAGGLPGKRHNANGHPLFRTGCAPVVVVVLDASPGQDTLVKMGYLKLVQREDERQAFMTGLMAEQLTQRGVEKHLADFGVDAESASQTQINQLSGGMKVKVVLAAAMWQNPHVLILDEPANHLDHEGLGALIRAIKDYKAPRHSREALRPKTHFGSWESCGLRHGGFHGGFHGG
eukprot:Skav234302  [mRNA]  locus=scaffold1018:67407:69453:+ [translate_table: standard]